MKTLPRLFFLLCCALVFLSSCGGKDIDPHAFHGRLYPPTDKVTYIFQSSQAPTNCRIFAKLLVDMPAGINGALMREQMDKEAKAHGADMVLIGQARRMNDDEGFHFIYYGNGGEYRCNDQWCGWKYGFDVWDKQGKFVSIGIDQWSNQAVSFPFPVMLQAAFIRCR